MVLMVLSVLALMMDLVIAFGITSRHTADHSDIARIIDAHVLDRAAATPTMDSLDAQISSFQFVLLGTGAMLYVCSGASRLADRCRTQSS